MFRTSSLHHQQDYVVHAAVYSMFSMRLCSPSTCFAYDEVYVVSVADSNTECISHHHSVEILAAETLPELRSSSVAKSWRISKLAQV
jgi:hypothetical protein